ncbi:MAG TPA: hypothetical protein IAC71_04645 [Candidatus Caccomonas pullistercoris]|nr:hypothetical protein [Candidatus Caccomonas pullistercoris]
MENFRANRYGNIRRALLRNQLRCLSEKLRFPRHRKRQPVENAVSGHTRDTLGGTNKKKDKEKKETSLT